ncbi:MAG: hypothetical protein F3740_10765 [Nitrospinae bacterium]|nr:hypothetical protein [Nitrospinota bacterium]
MDRSRFEENNNIDKRIQYNTNVSSFLYKKVMTSFELILIVGVACLLPVFCVMVLYWKEGKVIARLWRFVGTRYSKLQGRLNENNSPEEHRALVLVLDACSEKQENTENGIESIVADSLRLIYGIAHIYYPEGKKPLEQARIGEVFTAFREMNQQILTLLEFAGIDKVAQFRLREVVPCSEKGMNNVDTNKTILFGFSRIRSWLLNRLVIRSLKRLWILMTGEAAIKVYGRHQTDEAFEPEFLLDEMDQLQEDEDFPLPDEVRTIVETSRKSILLSIKPLPYKEAEFLYSALVTNIARFWHPQSSTPLYEVTVYDLLKCLAGYLEWAGRLNEKPVLNKMLDLKVSCLTGAKEVAIPFTDNQFYDWFKKYQVGRAAKWGRTIFKTLQKKQPGILFRDVALGIVKEGSKRWLMLYLHDKIAEETNKLYRA